MDKKVGNNNNDDIKKNGEGYPDPTAYHAVKRVQAETDEEKKRFRELLDQIYWDCRLAGFELKEHVVVKDKKTGKIWR